MLFLPMEELERDRFWAIIKVETDYQDEMFRIRENYQRKMEIIFEEYYYE